MTNRYNIQHKQKDEALNFLYGTDGKIHLDSLEKFNLHTHSSRCGHAEGLEPDYVREAIAAGIKTLGFSDHAPFPDKAVPNRMDFSQFSEYLDSISKVTEKNRDKINILKGVEIEFIPDELSYYEELYTRYKLDYILLGQHFYVDLDGDTSLTVRSKSSKHILCYAKTIREALNTGYFDILVHPDLFMSNNFLWDGYCEEAADIILEAAAENEVILEYNANGIRNGVKDTFADGPRYAYPYDYFWEKVAKTNIQIIPGSDAHNPSFVFDENMKLAWDKVMSSFK